VKVFRAHGGRAPEGVKYDFSVPVNPLGPPKTIERLIEEAVKTKVYARYPDYEYLKLRHAIAEFYGIEAENIVVLNGAAEGLNLLISCLRPELLIVFEPTFGDYRYLAYMLKIPIISIPYRERKDEFELDFDVAEHLAKHIKNRALILLSNPNNPTGAYVSPNIIESLARIYENAVLIVDEAFVELCEDCSSSQHLVKRCENVVVLRSFTKTFAIPGLRLGYLYTHNKDVLEVVESCRQPWNVNSIATYVFSRALTHNASELREFIEHSKHVIAIEREFLTKRLSELGVIVYNSHAPYILLRHYEFTASKANEALTKLGIYIRDASTFPYLTPYHVRIAVKLRDENVRLIEAYKVIGIR
jgi:histidinol-phosphate aminotransferase